MHGGLKFNALAEEVGRDDSHLIFRLGVFNGDNFQSRFDPHDFPGVIMFHLENIGMPLVSSEVFIPFS